MKVTNLTQRLFYYWGKQLLFGALMLSIAFPAISQIPCDPAAEFSYNSPSYCQNAPDPVPNHVTGVNGTYTFSAVSGGPNLSLSATTGTIDLSASDPGIYDVTNSVNTMSNGPMVIVGVVDGPLTGGTPKAMELYVLENIPSLSAFSLSLFANGNTNPNTTYNFPNIPAAAGTRIWIATEAPNFTTYFGFAPTFTSSVTNHNGDDAYRLFQGATVIDQFGEVGIDGTGTFWDYLDGWAYRVNNTGPDGATFPQANWIFSGINALDNTMTNADAMNPWPIGTHQNMLAATVSCTRQVEIVAPPLADAGPNQMVCENEIVTLAAVGNGSWSGGVGFFSNANSPVSTYTPAAIEIGTSVILTWTVPGMGGVCANAFDEMAITILDEADAEFTYPLSLVCPNGLTNPLPTHITGTDGRYTYSVVNGGPLLDLNPATGEINIGASNTGTYQVTNGVSGCGSLVISGVVDGPLTGGIPKAVEFYALTDIPDLSAYGFGSANNGGGSDGQEFTFPADAVPAGTHIWVATEATAFTAFFGFSPTYTNGLAPSINGDDAIELFCNGMVIDVFGDINMSGSGQPWDYLDGWAYRVSNTGPDASFFQLNNWVFSGINALDNETTNGTAANPFPINTYAGNQGGVCPNDFHMVLITINDTEPPTLVCPSAITVTLQGGLCEAAVQLSGVSATDNCDLDVEITQIGGIPFGQYFPIGNNPVTMQAKDDLGNTSTCTFDVVILEYPFPYQWLVCNDLVQFTLLQDGTAFVGADDILEGGPYGCYDDFEVTIANDTGFVFVNWLSCDEIGQDLVVQVTDPDNGNSCWGHIILEDKNPPVISCKDWTIPCTQSLNSVAKPSLTDNCDAHPTLILGGTSPIELDACDDNAVRFLRTWYAKDKYGNTSEPCFETITIERPTVVDFPSDKIFQCGQYSNSQLFPPSSGRPANIVGEYCKYNFTYSDEKIYTCSGVTSVFEIVRTWTVIDWCTGDIIITGVGGEDNIQLLKVMDNVPPVISATNLTVSANIPGVHPQPCRSTGTFPSPGVLDICSGVDHIVINTQVGQIVNGQIPAPGLPIGNHIVTIQAFDKCGNVSTKDIVLTVIDGIAPTPICISFTEVDLETSGYAEILADAFDQASHDNCCLDHFEVRRMDDDACDDGINDFEFGPSVHFCCEDAGKTKTVVFRAFDCWGNYNDCMVQVKVNDKLVPVLVSCPQNQRISCDWYADNLETQISSLSSPAEKSLLLDPVFGTPTFYDNCELTINRNYVSNIDQCLEGSMIRSFTATDPAGNTGVQACTQTIFIDHVSDWAVEFPADISISCGTNPPDFGEPQIFYETCELVAISHDDELFNVVDSACYKIVRTWTVINWCVVGTNPGIVDQEVIEQPENQLGLPFPQCDVDSDGDCDGRTFRDSWRSGQPANLNRPTVLDANRSTGPDTDLDSDPWDGYITYQQVIKVTDSVDPVFTNGCDIPMVCINDNTCDVDLLLPIPDVMDCSSNLTITTKIKIGGVWFSGLAPLTLADVPPGTYEVSYNAMDNCNNQSVCSTTVKVKDCKKPTPYCKNGIIVALMNSIPPMIEVWASDLDDNSFDNCSTDLNFSFSPDTTDTSIIFFCNNQNTTTFVDVWVTDECGNQDFCSTFITVQDNADVCGDPLINLGGLVTNEENESLEDVEMHLGGTTSGMAMTNSSGMFNFDIQAPGGDYTLVPQKDDNPLNGVTTFDLVLISKHVLGVTLLDSPFKIIAADANKSGNVSTFDMVEIRKLILFINDSFPNNTSWRFVDKNFSFPNPSNPWQTPFPEFYNVNDLNDDQLNVDFIGIKIGDVNGSAQTNNLTGQTGERTNGTDLIFQTKDVLVEKGQEVTVPFTVENIEALGFQFTLNFDQENLAFENLKGGAIASENFGLSLLGEGAITVSWNQPDGSSFRFEGEVFELTFKVKQSGSLSSMLSIDSRFTAAEAYTSIKERSGVSIRFESQIAKAGFELYQNSPNPFANQTEIAFNLASDSYCTITLMDISGKILKTIEGNFTEGHNKVSLKRRDLDASGVIYYRLETTEYTATKMMILMDK
ncbi:MAG: HYR domain-containing protein [Saprospiraceae bacterium]|nr:HYR domain-containing protein [Saprospiraceae bacterium]MCF8249691.1 HYR domain-containing protein [Saprospiraceae bacterium]MCF8279850.1 HYR domain-containing protein [Bacteroidales bacterium]MCF8312322.1 HYR domain-containing protein [Saprospiraceae bacterium]MCF8440681.1 HYR domain-containing protein [Saprospiraceae bacterium]